MPFREDILNPIPGENPCGEYLRKDPVYFDIREATIEDDDTLPKGQWQEREKDRKVADWPKVSRLCQETLAMRSKDLQIVNWLTQASVKVAGAGGLLDSLSLLESLANTFWDRIYPPIEEDDLELRAAPILSIAGSIPLTVKQFSITKNGFTFLSYDESRVVGYEADAQSDSQREARQAKIEKDHKLPPEDLDKDVEATPKAFYVRTEKQFSDLLARVCSLATLCKEKFKGPNERQGPNWEPARVAVDDALQIIQKLLEKKRESDPDPVTEAIPEEGATEVITTTSNTATAGGPATINLSVFTGQEPANRRVWIEQLTGLAAQMRAKDAGNPGPYLMLRGLRFGELRAAAARGELRQLEAPPTEIRRQLKAFAMDGKWGELLELAESAMALPCSRAWLDLQRLTVEACTNLGDDYHSIALGIRSAVKSLIADVPEIRNTTLMDDTPTANGETQVWLDQLMAEPAGATAETAETVAAPKPGWKKRFVDPARLAAEAIRKGDKPKGVEIMHAEIEAQRSGRGKFERRLELVELLCGPAGNPEVAQPLLDDLRAALEAHKLEEWEDDLVVRALTALYRFSAKAQDDSDEKKKLFERICRLNPARAFSLK